MGCGLLRWCSTSGSAAAEIEGSGVRRCSVPALDWCGETADGL